MRLVRLRPERREDVHVGVVMEITAWVCDMCGYWRKEESTRRHQTTNPSDPNGRMAVHILREATFTETIDDRIVSEEMSGYIPETIPEVP